MLEEFLAFKNYKKTLDTQSHTQIIFKIIKIKFSIIICVN